MAALADLAGVLGSRLQAGPLSSVPPSVVGGAVLAVGVGVGAAILQTTTSGLQGNARRRASDRKRQAKRDKSRRSIENLSARLRENPMSVSSFSPLKLFFFKRQGGNEEIGRTLSK